MKTIVITTDRNSDRFAGFVESADAAGITYEVYDGVDASNIEEGDELANRFKPRYLGIKKAMVGCTLSHINLYEQITETTLILEDDARFLPDFDLEEVEQAVKDSGCPVVHLHVNSYGTSPEEYGVHWMKPNDNVSTCAYVVTPEGAETFLAFCGERTEHGYVAPEIIDRFQLIAASSGLRIGILEPNPVAHSGLDSGIATPENYFTAEPKIRKPKELSPTEKLSEWWKVLDDNSKALIYKHAPDAILAWEREETGVMVKLILTNETPELQPLRDTVEAMINPPS